MSEFNRSDHPLNKTREKGIKVLKKEWQTLYNSNKDYASQLINDQALEFPTLFVLLHELEVRKDSVDLNDRNQIVINHVSNVLRGTDYGLTKESPFQDQHDTIVTSFLWILETGSDSIYSSDYIQVIDSTAIQVLLTFHQDYLEQIIRLLFFRNRHKSQRHYLLWAIYELCDPTILLHFSNYLLSEHPIDRKYAKQLLSFIPEVQSSTNEETFDVFVNWYEHNSPYLVYTGETNDVSPDHHPFRIHYAAKYLGIPISHKTGNPLLKLSSTDVRNYHYFIQLSEQEQMTLAEKSSKLRLQNRSKWKQILTYSFQDQRLFLNEGGRL
ncbi:hypothetical protein GMB86_13965 [Terrilactibacillus sp. BCM23-1]|uniref:Uncharacterized protein n=1 Tax=Terrilactibacillus tamarindi TaxID=2599694 RepID=A0A6N8CV43_9BACI|nr:hypothetical protein [Terrilactibacillus tamarindi]MTT33113.1 hypothetical protein [Terrilactibacillus tamarindi]